MTPHDRRGKKKKEKPLSEAVLHEKNKRQTGT